ncbi:hypothetical protein [Natronorubrum tibetense]|uniref:Uncharacterized protein n=1 Tax=Natronorubrum tibetense GA33 TaxID=1114856 RepID=L9W7G9_9EURY|nr:hypothetical protein [Natronorubrum tibetense]ELY45419.1 hypothetical protein C496_03323 [Natronorubrum tibetense GA33]
MRPAEERFTRHLVEGESVQQLASGTLLEDAVRGTAAVGATDRRILCVSKTGEFVDVSYDYICSIESQRRTRTEYRSSDENDRLLPLLGGLLGVGVLAVIVAANVPLDAFGASFTVGLAAATVVVASAVEYVRVQSSISRAYAPVFVGAGVLTLLALVGVALFAPSVYVPLYLLVTLGGGGLVAYAARHREHLSGPGLERHPETHLSINTIDGETIRIAIDAETDFDRELSACVHRYEDSIVDRAVAGTVIE